MGTSSTERFLKNLIDIAFGPPMSSLTPVRQRRQRILMRILILWAPVTAALGVMNAIVGQHYLEIAHFALVINIVLVLIFAARGKNVASTNFAFWGTVLMIGLTAMVAPTAGFISRNMLTIFVSATATAAVVLIGLHAVHRYQIHVMFSIALISNLMPYIHQGPVSSQSVQLFAATAVMMVICFVVALFEWRLSRDSESQLQAHINLNHELEEMHYAESRALADLTERYDTFNHDISTPVTALINLPNLLRSTGLSDEQARYVDTLERTHATVLAMVRDGRSGSSPAAGAPSVIRTIHVESFLSRILDQFHNSGSRDGMKISYRLPDPIPAIDVPLTDLTRIMNNLLHNAVKYAGNGTVIISGMLGSPAPASGYRTLTLTVRDTGVGMTESRLADVRAGLNGPDETVDSSRGIGLRSCRRLLAGHGGSLEIESREGAGTTVTVRIPVSVAE